MSEYENLLISIEDRLATVKVNRPKALNALNGGVLADLEQAFTELDQKSEVGCIILTGEGEKSFVAGADIAAMKTMTVLDAQKFCDLGHRAMLAVENCRKPVIAAVHGFCLGGGLELALACDFIFASGASKLGLPEVNLGLFPGFGGTQRLSRLIGKNRAKELIYTARMLSAAEAFQWGILNRVCEPSDLLSEVEAVAKDILKKGPVAISLAKEVVNRGTDLDLTSGLTLEKNSFPLIFATQDCKEGVSAFLEKRKAQFKGN